MPVRRIIQESTAPEVVADSPGPVPRSKEEHLTDEIVPAAVTFHGDPFPPYCCPHCESRKREGLAVKARVRLARQAVADREPWGVLANHIVELVAMLEARGLA